MKLNDNVKDKDSQLVQTRRTLKKYKKIVESKNLGERDHLANKLTSAESALDESRRRVQVRSYAWTWGKGTNTSPKKFNKR